MPLKYSLPPTSAKVMIVFSPPPSRSTIWQASHLPPPQEAWKLRADAANPKEKKKNIWQKLTFNFCWNCCYQDYEDMHTLHVEVILLLNTPSLVLCASVPGIKVFLDVFALYFPSPPLRFSSKLLLCELVLFTCLIHLISCCSQDQNFPCKRLRVERGRTMS